MTPDADRFLLLDAVDEGPLDDHARLVAQLLGVDTALVTVLDEHEQRFLGMVGLDGPAARRRGTPLDRSLCRAVAATRGPLRIDDLGADEAWRGHLARTEMDIDAYLGVPLTTPDGEVVGAVCAVRHEPHVWSDRDQELIAAMRDIVQVELRAQLRAQRESSRAQEISLLLSTLRHELGGELQVVLGGIETALLPGLEPDLRDRVLGNARRDCRRIIDTLDALLRMDSRAPTRRREIDVSQLLEDVVDAQPLRDDTRVTVDAPAVRLVTEPVLLAHVVRNLLENAGKYSRDEIVVKARRRGDDHVEVSVADRGPGIPDEVVTQLFEPFSRPRDDGGESGFGLGLYIIRMLCERLDAGLEVDSDSGGTTVTVVLPMDQSPNPSNAASSSDGA